MVHIKKGAHTALVSMGAFKNLYEPMGYVIVRAGEATTAPLAPDKGVTPVDAKKPATDVPEASEDAVDSYVDEDGDEEDELEEKPLSEMNFRELKTYASRLGLNVNGVNSKRELKTLIIKATKS